MSRRTAEQPVSGATAANPTEAQVTNSRSRSLFDVAVDGQTLETLEAIRDQIAADLVVCESMRDRAALYLRLTDTLKTIEAIRPPYVKGDAVDEIAARRAARRAGAAAHSSRAKNSG